MYFVERSWLLFGRCNFEFSTVKNSNYYESLNVSIFTLQGNDAKSQSTTRLDGTGTIHYTRLHPQGKGGPKGFLWIMDHNRGL